MKITYQDYGCVFSTRKSEKILISHALIFMNRTLSVLFCCRTTAAAAETDEKMPTSGRKIFEKRKCLHVFVFFLMGGFWKGEKKIQTLFLPCEERGEKIAHEKKQKKNV